MTLGIWLDSWYNLYVLPDSRRAQSTKAAYGRALASIPSAVRAIELSALSGIDLQVLIRGACDRWEIRSVSGFTDSASFSGPPCGFAGGPRAAQLLLITLRQALRIAVKLGYCSPSVIDPDVVVMPEHKPRQATVLRPDQLREYLHAAAQSEVYPLCLFAACGLRRGEALGVRWEDIDRASGVLTIRRQRLRINREYQTLPLKSASSYRALVLPPSVLDALDSWPRSFSGWVCDCTPERWNKVHKRILQIAGLPACTIHGLRHTFATIAAHQMPIKAVQQALGHSNFKLTADLYAAHLLLPCDAPLHVMEGVL